MLWVGLQACMMLITFLPYTVSICAGSDKDQLKVKGGDKKIWNLKKGNF